MFYKLRSLFSATLTVFAAAFVLATVFAFSFFASSDTYAHTATITTSGTINIDVTPAGVGGSNGASIGTDNVVVNSSCPLGYTVSISGLADNTLYKNGDSTNTGTNQKITASAGTAQSPASILGNNLGTWGYTTEANATTSSNFIGLTSAITTLTTKNAASGDGSGDPTTGVDTIPVYFGVSAPSTLESGLYKLAETSQGAGDNVITYYLTADAACDSYIIKYNDNGANSTTTMTGMTHSVTENSEINLAPSNFQRSGYGFAGWSTEQLNPDANDFNTQLNTAKTAGLVFGPMETINISSTIISKAVVENSQQVIKLYAVWIKSAGNLQGWTGCSSLASGAVTALTDQRDNNTYAVAKLADGKCWMIENLRLDNTNSDNTTGVLAQGYNSSFKGLATAESPWANNSITANSLYSTDGSNNTTAVAGDNQSYRFPRYNNNNTNTAVANMTTPTNTNIYSYGNYYTWPAVVADTTDYTSTTTISNTSICPTGWHVPTGGSGGGEYNTLNTNANSGATNSSLGLRVFPNNFLYSGYVGSSSVGARGGSGWYWSSVTSNSSDSYQLVLGGSVVAPTSVSSKHRGLAARCVASEPSYMVNFDANGGTGTMNAQTISYGTATALTSNAFTAPTNKVFAGWNTAADGSGTSYTNGESVTNIAPLFGSVTLYAQWRCQANYVCYDDNGANSLTKMGNQSVSASAATIDLWPSNFQRSGYGFAGWSTEKLDADASDFQTKLTAAKNAGHVYGPMETLTITAGQYSTLGLQLYAIWVPSAGNLQSWTGCSSLAQDAVIALKDIRDNQVYAITKLTDGKCWMMENLRLGGTAAMTLDSDTTDIADGTIFALSASTDPTKEAWCTNLDVACIDQSALASNNTTNTKNNMTSVTFNNDDNTGIYSMGNYYNWYSATAGTGTRSTTSGNAAGSICPKGWHLPTGAADGEFYALNTVFNSGSVNTDAGLRTYPSNLIRSGYVNSSSLSSRGVEGHLWSSTAASGGTAYRLLFYSTFTGQGVGSFGKYGGYTIRCLIGS